MARGNTEHDQADWNVCISWQRMFVSCETNSHRLRIPITLFLHETRGIVDRGDPRTSNRAYQDLREAWRALENDDEWMACVLGCQTRALAAGDLSSDRKAFEGQALCILIRASYAKAPPRFEKTGRLTHRGEP